MKLLRNKFLIRTLSFLFIIEIVSSTLLPTLSWALTSGPTAPEATSFEPVDTTDMVNLATGDLVYNIPLLEVPGPSGGYPLSLSYHAGIMPNEDASWVGLGWTLNPGAISRTVNGYPDDQVAAIRRRSDVWTGGETHSFSVGVGVPGASFGLTVSNDSNQGVGVGVSTSLGLNYSVGPIGVSAGVTSGSGPYGGSYHGTYAAVGLTVANVQNLSLNVGVSTNFKTTSFNGGVSMNTTDGSGQLTGSQNLMGASISSNGLKPSMSVGGINLATNNDRAGNITTDGYGFSVPVPIGPVILNLGYNYQRYFSDESSVVKAIGSLHTYESLSRNRNEFSFDSYSLPDADSNKEILNDNDPDKAKGGSFPAYDNYSVNAQGLSGSIQPHIFENGNLYRQNVNRSGHNVEFKSFGVAGSAFYRKVNFRFKNDFSNSYDYAANEMRYENQNTYFTNTKDNLTPAGGFNDQDQHLAGSKHIEWYSNAEIKNGNAKANGFVDCKSNEEREIVKYGYDVAKQVGGFSITNESGVTYHYALPVYAYGEFSKSFSSEKPNDIFQNNTNFQPYAYTWFLTGITGPDFIDRGGTNNDANGIIDEEDWGYWVKFDYDLHANEYRWRNPATGFHKDIDQKFEFYSYGKKEVYYLSTIKTKSHAARFVKSERLDGKGVTDMVGGTFAIEQIAEPYPIPDCNPDDCTDPDERVCADYCTGYNYYEIPPQSTLKLDAIELYKAEDFSSNPSLSDVVRVIELSTDYSLCPGTVNSFNNSNVNEKFGKLSLKKLEFKGKGGAGGMLPPMKFEYDYAENYTLASIKDNNHMDSPSLNGIPGNLIKVRHQNTIAYYLITDLVNGINTLKFLGGERLPDDNQWYSVSYSITKNPPFNSELVDSWGFYKSDVEDIPGLRDIDRSVTTKSSMNVDAWSLSKISTSTGATILINYESDTYSSVGVSVLNRITIPVMNMIQGNPLTKEVILELGGDFKHILSEYSTLDLVVLLSYPFDYGYSEFNPMWCSPTNGYYPKEKDADYYFTAKTCEFVQAGNSQLTINNANIFDALSKRPNSDFFNITYKPTKTIASYLRLRDESPNILGGGIRVSSIALRSNNKTSKTIYSYHSNDSNQSFGSTTYEPNKLVALEPIIPSDEYHRSNCVQQGALNGYFKSLQSNFTNLLNISRDIPSPGILYSQVTVKEILDNEGIEHSFGKKVFHFESFNPEFVGLKKMNALTDAGAVTCYNSDGERVPCNPTFDEDCEDAEPGTRPCLEENRPSECFDSNGNSVSCGAGGSTTYSPLTIDDYSSFVGALKSISVYGTNDQLLSKTENHYLHDGKPLETFSSELKAKFNNQGKTTQVFNEYRVVNGSHLRVFSKKSEYPLVLIGQSQTDYKSGLSTISTNLAFDFYTGMATKVLTVDGYGNNFLSESKSAYLIDEYSGMTNQQITNGTAGMGLKVRNSKNKNMLTQEAYSITRKVVPTDPLLPIDNTNYTPVGIVSASAQTWSNQIPALYNSETETTQNPQSGVWRKHASYSFIGNDAVPLGSDGLLAASEFSDFTAWTRGATTPEKWQKNAEITLYDVASHALEAMDMNDDYAATKTDSKHERVLATVANARYTEFAYSGAEDEETNGHFGGHVLKVGTLSTDKAHTGTKSIVANSGQGAFKYNAVVSSAKKLYASVWSDRSDGKIMYKINGGAATAATLMPVKQAGDWYQLNAMLPDVAENASVEIWCEASGALTYFDDFRVHPHDAAMISYVYNEWGELSHILDNNNMFTEYLYDAMGRLTDTKRETFSKGVVRTSKTEYYYKEPVTGGNQ